jgi:hypothetical protein
MMPSFLRKLDRKIGPNNISLVHPQSESLPPPERLPDDVYEDLAQEQCERMSHAAYCTRESPHRQCTRDSFPHAVWAALHFNFLSCESSDMSCHAGWLNRAALQSHSKVMAQF